MSISFRSKIAQQLVEHELGKIDDRNPPLGYHTGKDDKVTWSKLADTSSPRTDDALFPSDFKYHVPHSRKPENPFSLPVAIIGAGVAGLRIAMMLKYLGIPCQIFEASNRYGGRVFTRDFPKREGERESHQNFFDVGAMRFPDNATSARTFEIFKELDITKAGGKGGKLSPYHLATDDNILLYNGIKKTIGEVNKEPGKDHFNDGVSKGGTVPDEYIKKEYTKINGEKVYGVDACLAAAHEPYKDLLVKDFKSGWEELMKQDFRSNRSYLLDVMKYPFSVVQWMETRDSGTGGFDAAFSEAIIESLEFDYPAGYDPNSAQPKEIEWWCIEGGSGVLTKAMYKSLGHNPPLATSCTVTSVSKSSIPGSDRTIMEITIADSSSSLDTHSPPIKCSHVVSTIPLSRLRTVDLDGCDLDYTQRMALRSLDYSIGVKVGIKFKERWWQNESFKLQGGQSKTDRQSRVVVYPNYGLQDPADIPGVLIASYCWNQDAFRFGSLIQSKDWSDPPTAFADRSAVENYLLNQVFTDLSRIHGKTPEWYKEQVVDYYAYDWYHNPYTMGAYAMFGAGKFSGLYPSITKPASDGVLHFGGEVASSHHAWVAGALDSAWRCVWEILAKDGTEEQKKLFKEKYGDQKPFDNVETAVKQYYRGLFANSLEKPKGNHDDKFPVYF